MHMYVQYTYTHIHTVHTVHTYIHTYIHTYVHTYVHTYIHTRVHLLTDIPKQACVPSLEECDIKE